MKSGKIAFSLRFYINSRGLENPRFQRNLIRCEKSVTPVTLVDNQYVVVTLAGFSFYITIVKVRQCIRNNAFLLFRL